MEEKQKCHACGQTIDYTFEMDRGTVNILKKIAHFIRNKGLNVVHLNKEMVPVHLTAHEYGNRNRLKAHGLIAHIGERGNYCLTRKGLDFLNGKPIPSSVKIKKNGVGGESSRTVWHSDEMVTVAQIDKEWGPYWSANGYDIKEGRVVYAQNT